MVLINCLNIPDLALLYTELTYNMPSNIGVCNCNCFC